MTGGVSAASHYPVLPLGLIADNARDRWGQFLVAGVAAGAADRDAMGVECERELFREAVGNGLFGYALPEELGGSGADALHWGLVLEQVGYLCGDGSFASLLGLRVSMVEAILSCGREDLIAPLVGPMTRGELFGAFAYTDGADPFSFSTTARRDGGRVVVDGSKSIVTGAQGADVFLLFARDSETSELIIVLLRRDDPGLTVVPLDTVGLRASGLGRLELETVTVSQDRILLHEDGVSRAQRMLNARRIMLVAPQVGAMQAVHELCIRELASTTRFCSPLTELQNVQAALGRQDIMIRTARATLYAALAHAAGYHPGLDGLFDPVLSAAKHAITNLGIELATSAMRLLGAQGFCAGTVERFWRDCQGLLAGGGTQDLLEIDLGIRAIADYDHTRTDLLTERSA